MEQLLAHLVGDYVLQSDWMALNKKLAGFRGDIACAIHAVMYTLPFVFLTGSYSALLLIAVSHFVVDRTHVSSRLTWFKNWMSVEWIDRGDGKLIANRSYEECSKNFGYDPARPFAVTFFLSVVFDNTIHLLMNYAVLRWFA